jgi:hypothetical protein
MNSVRDLIAWNNCQTSSKTKILITPVLIQKYLDCTLPGAKALYTMHKKEIIFNHKAHGLNRGHNRRNPNHFKIAWKELTKGK